MALTDESVLEGGCLCGAVRYRVVGKPLHSGLCHCLDCQKATGSAFVAYMAYPADRFSYTGDVRAYDHQTDRGPVSRRNFCPNCGSTVFGGGDYEGANIYAGTLDDASQFEPAAQIYTRSRRAWAHLPPGSTFELDKL